MLRCTRIGKVAALWTYTEIIGTRCSKGFKIELEDIRNRSDWSARS